MKEESPDDVLAASQLLALNI